MNEDPLDVLDRTNTAIVVDSCADLPDEVLADPNLTMVPLKLHFGDDTFRDWIDIRPAEFYARSADGGAAFPRPPNPPRESSRASTGGCANASTTSSRST